MIPTEEEYLKAKELHDYCCTGLRMTRDRQAELIDALCEERKSEKSYLNLIDKQKEIIFMYETYLKLNVDDKNGE